MSYYALVLNGDLVDGDAIMPLLQRASMVIAVDGGTDHLTRLNYRPELLIGDFDSVASDSFEYWRELGCEVKTFPKRKDFTDGELALDYLLTEVVDGSDAIHIDMIAAFGKRYDHLLANQLLAVELVERYGIEIMLTDGETVQLIAGSGNHCLCCPPTDTVISLIAHRDAEVSLSTEDNFCLSYPVEDLCLKVGTCLGVSNKLLPKKRLATTSLSKEVSLNLTVNSGIVSLILTPEI